MSNLDLKEVSTRYWTKSLPQDPMELLRSWHSCAKKNDTDADTILVASTRMDQLPQLDRLQLEIIEQQRLIFFCHSQSNVAKNIFAQADIALHFHWRTQERELTLYGQGQELEPHLSDYLFEHHTLAEQIGMVASPKDQAIQDRHVLEHALAQFKAQAAQKGQLARPDFYIAFAFAFRDNRVFSNKRAGKAEAEQ